MKIQHKLVGLVLLMVATSAAVGPANAALVTQSAPDIHTQTGVSANCVQAAIGAGMNPPDADASCTYTLTTNVYATPQFLTTKIGAHGLATTTGTVQKIQWEQIFQNLSYKEVHRGTAYYDGTRAWSTTSYRGVIGSHTCHSAGSYYWAAVISNNNCTTETSQSGASIVERDTYDVSAVVQGFPLGYTEAISVLINCNGGYVERLF